MPCIGKNSSLVNTCFLDNWRLLRIQLRRLDQQPFRAFPQKASSFNCNLSSRNNLSGLTPIVFCSIVRPVTTGFVVDCGDEKKFSRKNYAPLGGGYPAPLPARKRATALSHFVGALDVSADGGQGCIDNGAATAERIGGPAMVEMAAPLPAAEFPLQRLNAGHVQDGESGFRHDLMGD